MPQNMRMILQSFNLICFVSNTLATHQSFSNIMITGIVFNLYLGSTQNCLEVIEAKFYVFLMWQFQGQEFSFLVNEVSILS